MILDEVRLRNWLATASVPEDVRDTVEDLLERLRIETDFSSKVDEENDQLRAQNLEFGVRIQEMLDEKKKPEEIAMPPQVPVTRPNESEMRIITSKYPGTCKDCGGAIAAGQQVRWSKAIGAKHLVGECR